MSSLSQRLMNDTNQDFQSLLNYAYFFLKFRPRTENEMRRYLLKKIKTRHWSTDAVKMAIACLKEQKLIDDAEFTRWFIEGRVKTKAKSKFILVQELLRLGVDKETIDEYFLQNEIDEEKLALKTLRSRWGRFENLEKRQRFQKASQFLLRRGFEFDLVKKTIVKIDKNE